MVYGIALGVLVVFLVMAYIQHLKTINARYEQHDPTSDYRAGMIWGRRQAIVQLRDAGFAGSAAFLEEGEGPNQCA